MRQQRYGRIVNYSSVSGLSGNSGQANYGAAKAGVAGLTRVAAKDLGRYGVTVNCIAPGYFETDMATSLKHHPVRGPQILDRIPAGRWGTVEIRPVVEVPGLPT